MSIDIISRDKELYKNAFPFDDKLWMYSYRNHFHVINTIYAYVITAVTNADDKRCSLYSKQSIHPAASALV